MNEAAAAQLFVGVAMCVGLRSGISRQPRYLLAYRRQAFIKG